jgi:hypothetical protein
MLDVNQGIRELSTQEIAAVSGGVVASSSSVYCYLKAVECVVDKVGGDSYCAPTMVKAVDKFLDCLLRSKFV